MYCRNQARLSSASTRLPRYLPDPVCWTSEKLPPSPGWMGSQATVTSFQLLGSVDANALGKIRVRKSRKVESYWLFRLLSNHHAGSLERCSGIFSVYSKSQKFEEIDRICHILSTKVAFSLKNTLEKLPVHIKKKGKNEVLSPLFIFFFWLALFLWWIVSWR